MYHNYPEDVKFDENTKSILQWQITMQFNPSIVLASWICSWVWIMSNSNTYLYRFSINQWWLQWRSLETLSNFFPAFGQKTFMSHLGLRIHRMRSPLTRSDRFHIDLLTTFIYTPPYPEYPVHILMSCLGMNQNISSCA